MSANTLLLSVEMLKERTSIHTNVDEKLVYADIKFAQDKYILPLLGTALFNKLQTIIEGEDMNEVANANYKLLWQTYIIDALCYFTMAEMPLSLGFQFFNKGVLRKTSENADTPSMSELFDVASRYKDRAEMYAQKMKEYLRAHASATNCPEYLSPGSTSDTVIPDPYAFTLPINLDIEGDAPSCVNWQPYQP
jgi:hypothetical protein